MGEVTGNVLGGLLGRLRAFEPAASPRRVTLALALVMLNLADVALTKAVLHHGGVEANPVMAGLMEGLAAPIGLKFLVAGLAGLLLLCCPPQAKVGERAVVAVVALYGVIVVWNTVVLTILLAR